MIEPGPQLEAMDTSTLLTAMMPVSFQGLVVESTSRCNAKCAMCYQSAGPQGSDNWGKSALTPERIEEVLRDAFTIPSLEHRFHLAGGEAFLNVGDCLRLFAYARGVGYTDITTTTNAYWASTPAKAHTVCHAARQAGLLRMEISWDHWHLDHIKPDMVSNALDACATVGISTILRILTTRGHSAEEALGLLRPDSLAVATEIQSGPVFPTGRAERTIPVSEIFYGGNLSSTCHGVLHLTVNAWGKVYPCCAGADQTEGLAFGNVNETPIYEIAERMNQSRLLRTLVFQGVGALLPILSDAGIDIGTRFSSICHACWSVFSHPDRAEIVHRHFADLERDLSETRQRRLEALMTAGSQAGAEILA